MDGNLLQTEPINQYGTVQEENMEMANTQSTLETEMDNYLVRLQEMDIQSASDETFRGMFEEARDKFLKKGDDVAEMWKEKIRTNDDLRDKFLKLPAPVTYAWKDIYYRNGNTMYLSGVSGYLEPGQMLAILGAPDSQMDLFLRVIARRDVPGEVFGTLQLNGSPPDNDFYTRTSYVPKYEVALPTLTVQESLYNSYRLRCDRELDHKVIGMRVILSMHELGLEHRKDVVVGDAMIRGVSGGERRRVTFGCEIGGVSSLLFADLPTNGLDSASALDIVEKMRKFSERNKLAIIMTLAQPAPELLMNFENLLLLAKGCQIYFGPIVEAQEYFEKLGFIKPEETSLPDFLQELTGDPVHFYHADKDTRSKTEMREERGTYQDLAQAWIDSELYTELGMKLWKEFKGQIRNDPPLYQTNQYYSTQLMTLVMRQWIYIRRNAQMSHARLVQALVLGLIVGSCFFDLDDSSDDIITRYGALFFMVSNLTFSSSPIIPIFFQMKTVHFFQTKSRYYSPPFFFFAFLVVETFWAVLEVTLLTTIIYAMEGLYGDPWASVQFWYFWITSVVVHQTSRHMTMGLSCLSPTAEVAYGLIPVLFLFHMMSNGYLISVDDLSNVWYAFNRINFQGWAWRGMCINEFWHLTFYKDEDYCQGNITCEEEFKKAGISTNSDGTQKIEVSGEYALSLYGIRPDSEAEKWDCFFYLCLIYGAWFLIALLASSLTIWEPFVETKITHTLINRRKTERVIKERSKTKQSMDINASPNVQASPSSSSVMGMQSLSVAPVDKSQKVEMAFRNLNYHVYVKGRCGKILKDIHILHDCYGFVSPGNLLALMGPSGAGKTTLLDVLADRKSVGEYTGDIYINGYPKDDKTFPYVAGYCEQFDSHVETQTVYEAIEFTARLRLPADTTDAMIGRKVDYTLSRLGLQAVRDDVIGDDYTGGIAPEFRKKCTIACEVVMEPDLIFLDEPTTGLDSASARNVIDVVKDLSKDVAVVCTIHQPSAEIFNKFNQMLLMERGGRICYFGETATMGDYFESIGFPPKDPAQNVADYALECSQNKGLQYDGKKAATLWEESERAAQYRKIVDKAVETPGEQFVVDLDSYPGFIEELKVVCERYWSDLMRRQADMLSRLGANFMISILIGWVFYDLPIESQTGTTSRLAAMFMLVCLTTFGSMLLVPAIIRSRPSIYRERKSLMYGPLSVWLSHLICQTPIQCVEAVILSVPAYYMVGLYASSKAFFTFMLFVGLTIFTNGALRELLAYLSPTEEICVGLSGLNNVLFILFAGFIIRYDAIRSYWLWMYYSDLLRYGLGAMVRNEFEHIGTISTNPQDHYHDGDQVISDFNADEFTIGEYAYIMFGIWVVLKLLGLVAFSTVNHIKK